jgi:hypothetical protein
MIASAVVFAINVRRFRDLTTPVRWQSVSASKSSIGFPFCPQTIGAQRANLKSFPSQGIGNKARGNGLKNSGSGQSVVMRETLGSQHEPEWTLAMPPMLASRKGREFYQVRRRPLYCTGVQFDELCWRTVTVA